MLVYILKQRVMNRMIIKKKTIYRKVKGEFSRKLANFIHLPGNFKACFRYKVIYAQASMQQPTHTPRHIQSQHTHTRIHKQALASRNGHYNNIKAKVRKQYKQHRNESTTQALGLMPGHGTSRLEPPCPSRYLTRTTVATQSQQQQQEQQQHRQWQQTNNYNKN